MAPDLNSLPSPVSQTQPRNMTSDVSNSATVGDVPPADSISPPPPSAATSLQAAATMNAGLQQEQSRRGFCPKDDLLDYTLPLTMITGSSNGSMSRVRQSPLSGRRRSAVLMNLQHNDPSMPAPGEAVNDERPARSPHPTSGSPLLTGGDPHHSRAPSLGELHQELEAEQEAQVVCMLMLASIFMSGC